MLRVVAGGLRLKSEATRRTDFRDHPHDRPRPRRTGRS